MPEVCQMCGLPTELCVCQDIAKERQRINIYIVKRKYGKIITIIEGLEKDIDINALAKTLKSKCACGGTVKNNTIELQGDHRPKAQGKLIENGFSPDTIKVK